MPWQKNVELIGYHSLNDRPGFKLAMQEAGGNFFLYVGIPPHGPLGQPGRRPRPTASSSGTWTRLQIFDISEPKDPYVAGFYIPDDPPSRLGPLTETLVTQAEDVLVDRRGYIYMTEKSSGLYILGFDSAGRA